MARKKKDGEFTMTVLIQWENISLQTAVDLENFIKDGLSRSDYNLGEVTIQISNEPECTCGE